jgi:uncharacterized protein YdeI (YjbR/CyaY-like superfamily)
MSSKNSVVELPTIQFASVEAWERWLAKNHENAPGVWIRFAKKGSGIESVNYKEALDAALCYGWIDSQTKKYDDNTYLQKWTPRTRKSMWSKINREKVAVLIENGQMKAAGLAEIEHAKADGRWEAAYDSPANATVPEDLQNALNKSERAKAAFEELTKSQRYSILFRIQTAKRAETRAKRIQQFVEQLEKDESLFL